jgi:hypothetical protein
MGSKNAGAADAIIVFFCSYSIEMKADEESEKEKLESYDKFFAIIKYSQSL